MTAPVASLSNEYLGRAVENLRKCLRDLNRISDRPTALASRERCKHWMGQAVTIFNEMREAHDDALVEIENLQMEIAAQTTWNERFEWLVERVADVRRGILTLDEVTKLAEDMTYGETVNIK